MHACICCGVKNNTLLMSCSVRIHIYSIVYTIYRVHWDPGIPWDPGSTDWIFTIIYDDPTGIVHVNVTKSNTKVYDRTCICKLMY